MEYIGSPEAKKEAKISYDEKRVGELFLVDRAQSRFFTVTLSSLASSNIRIGVNGDIEALPVKNISYTITGIDSMSLSIGVFKDIPIPVGKKLPKITLTLVDDRMDQIETDIRSWCNDSMLPARTGMTRYLDDMVSTLTYNSYDTCGQLNFTYTASVMLTDDVTLTRDTESNELKSIEIALVILEDDITIVNDYKGIPTPIRPEEPTAPKPPILPPENNNSNTNFIPQPIIPLGFNGGPIDTGGITGQPQPIFNI